MTPRAASTIQRVRIAALSVGAVLVAGGVAVRAAGAGLAEKRPDLALCLAPGFTPALEALAEKRLAQGRPAAAAQLARQALQRDPLDLTALRTLGFTAAAEARPAQAEAIMEAAGRRSWRDGPTHAWLLQRRLEEGRVADAVTQADSLLRTQDEEPAQALLFKILLAMVGDANGRRATARRLADDPPWRVVFLQSLRADSGDAPAAEALLASMSRGPAPPSPVETGAFVNGLVQQKRYGEALAAWNTSPHPPGEGSALLRDGDFAGRSDATAFTWSAEEGPGATADVEPAPQSNGGFGLRVQYDGYSLPNLPGQLLVLPPGSYVLTWEQFDPDQGAVAALKWSIRCADGGPLLADGAPTPAGVGWRRERLAFQTPAGQCPAQTLRLMPVAGERRTDTIRWFRAMRLEHSS